MSFPLPVPDELRQVLRPGSGVLLGVSGGVDSSVSLALLKALDCDVHCVTLKNFCTGDDRFGGQDNRSCCSDASIREAAATAARFGARHMVGNVEDAFRRTVISPFVSEYLDGRTPNPCVACNAGVRFPRLLDLADFKGLDFVATGHYARIVRGAGDSRLYRGLDPRKDQSYFLHGLGAAALDRAVFPLGWYTKTRVRAAAEALGLSSARRPDSQEICFVPDDDRTFLFREGGGAAGEIVDAEGRVLGRHRGLEHYTVGQRRGLGVSAPDPLYVIELRAAENRVVLGPRRDLAVRRLECDRFGLLPGISREDLVRSRGLTAQIRHRHAGAAVASVDISGEACLVEFDGPAEGVAPGQSMVLYAADSYGDRVVGGGRILRTYRNKGADHV